MSIAALDVETRGFGGDILCVSFAYRLEDGELHTQTVTSMDDAAEIISGFDKLAMHNAKYDLVQLWKAGVDLAPLHGAVEDTLLMSYVDFPDRPGGHALAAWGERLGYDKLEAPEFEEYSDELATYCERDTAITLVLYEELNSRLDESARHFYEHVEKSFLLYIIQMEQVGIPLDVELLLDAKPTLEQSKEEALGQLRRFAGGPVPAQLKKYKKPHPEKVESGELIYESADDVYYYYRTLVPLNPSANNQLTYVLQNRLGWKPKEYTESGQPTLDEHTLSKLTLSNNSDIKKFAESLLEYRHREKILSTFVDGMLSKVSSNNKLHPSYNQTSVVTGRLSCSNPNLQQIPSKGEDAKLLRSAVRAPDGYKVVAADISQFQYRIAVHYFMLFFGYGNREDVDELVANYLADGDVHEKHRQLLEPHVPELMASDDGRKYAKTFGFSMLFGAGPDKIARSQGLNVEDARKILDAGKKAISCVDDFKQFVVSLCRNNSGVITDLYGRRLVYPDVVSEDKTKRARAERQIFNALIQSTEATIMKIMLPQILEEAPCLTPIAQVHDEYVFLCPDGQTEEACAKIEDVMSRNWLPGDGTTTPHIPVKGDAGAGSTWYEAKPE